MVVQVARIIGFLAPSIWALLPTEAAPPVTPVQLGDEFLWQLEVDLFLKTPPPPPPPPPIPVVEEIKVEKPKPKPAPKPAPPTRKPTANAILDCIAKYEGTYTSVNPTGKYRGRYQMDNSLWQTYGGDPRYVGRMQEAPPEMQDEVAWNGFLARGLSPWPTPSRQCAHLL